MMKLAFASCMCTAAFKKQPVWDDIAAHQPDALVLLGDSVYTDIHAPSDPQTMGDDEFAQYLFSLYRELLAQPQFVRLVKSLPLAPVMTTRGREGAVVMAWANAFPCRWPRAFSSD